MLQSKVYDSYLTKSKPRVYQVDDKGKNILINDHHAKVRFWQLKSHPSQNFSVYEALEKSALKLKGFDFYVT